MSSLHDPSGAGSHPRRRLQHLWRCTAEIADDRFAAARPWASAAAAATELSPSSSAGAVRPLTKNQLKRFIRDGFIVLQVDDLPNGFHDQLYAGPTTLSRTLSLSVLSRSRMSLV